MTPPSNSSSDRPDTIVLARIRAGDPDLFETLFRVEYAGLVQFASSLVHDSVRAEELVCDVFTGLWVSRNTVTVRESLRAWLYGAVRNRAISLIRHDVTADRALPHLGGSIPASAPSPDAVLLDAEQTAVVRRAVAALPPRAREAFQLKLDHGLTYPEIAEAMGLSVKTVELHISRAYRGLREALQDIR